MVKPMIVYFYFLAWFTITTFSAITKDIDKYDVIYRYIITFIISSIILFLYIELGWLK